MNCTLIEYDYEKGRIYAISQIDGQSLVYMDVSLDKDGIESINRWESQMNGLFWAMKRPDEQS